MKFVLDSSVAVKWALLEIDSDVAIRLRDAYSNSVHELLAPDIFPAEIANAFTRAERRKIIAVGQALPLFADIMRTAPVFRPYHQLATRAIEISSLARIGVYDCLYVALAEREGCPLITADDRLVRNLQPQFPFVIGLASLP